MATFKSFMVTNTVSPPKKETLEKKIVETKNSKNKKNLVWRDIWFTLKKFELKKRHPIEDSKLPLKVR